MSHPQPLQIVIVSSSQSLAWRARLVAHHARGTLQNALVTVDFIDRHEHPLPTYPHAEGDAALAELIQRFNADDGWVLAVPVYNWGRRLSSPIFCTIRWMTTRRGSKEQITSFFCHDIERILLFAHPLQKPPLYQFLHGVIGSFAAEWGDIGKIGRARLPFFVGKAPQLTL